MWLPFAGFVAKIDVRETGRPKHDRTLA